MFGIVLYTCTSVVSNVTYNCGITNMASSEHFSVSSICCHKCINGARVLTTNTLWGSQAGVLYFIYLFTVLTHSLTHTGQVQLVIRQ